MSGLGRKKETGSYRDGGDNPHPSSSSSSTQHHFSGSYEFPLPEGSPLDRARRAAMEVTKWNEALGEAMKREGINASNQNSGQIPIEIMNEALSAAMEREGIGASNKSSAKQLARDESTREKGKGKEVQLSTPEPRESVAGSSNLGKRAELKSSKLNKDVGYSERKIKAIEDTLDAIAEESRRHSGDPSAGAEYMRKINSLVKSLIEKYPDARQEYEQRSIKRIMELTK